MVHPTAGDAVGSASVAVVRVMCRGGEDQAALLEPADRSGDGCGVRPPVEKVGGEETQVEEEKKSGEEGRDPIEVEPNRGQCGEHRKTRVSVELSETVAGHVE